MEKIEQQFSCEKKTLTKSEVAKMLGVTNGTIDNYVRKGIINAIKLGQSKQSRCYYTLSEIKTLLKID